MQAYVRRNGIVTMGASWLMSPIMMNVTVTTATTTIEYTGTLFGPLPCPRNSNPGITFSLAMLCNTLGVPYMAPRHELMELTYRPASSNTVTADISAVIERFFSNPSLVTVHANVIINIKYKNVPVPIAAKDPLGILADGFFKSPLMLIPAKMPVMVGKNTPKHLNQV
ncbi:unnamed protein product [Chrysodeixis includens]|uniref:Uncharacterized protein n=1 Tax=Chrysodeixis includens TaxID=689277 RepID=A0A9N8KXC4_CHRIL|nr:unnamed protein product [Chrysodeixis includens]